MKKYVIEMRERYKIKSFDITSNSLVNSLAYLIINKNS